MSGERYTFDANVLVYSVDCSAGEKHGRAMMLVDGAIERECVLTIQALGEFFFVVTRKGIAPAADAAAQVGDWLHVFPTAAANDAALRRALDTTRRSRLGFWDAMLLATACEAGCDVVLSEDLQDGMRLHGVTVRNPFVGTALPAAVQRLMDR